MKIDLCIKEVTRGVGKKNSSVYEKIANKEIEGVEEMETDHNEIYPETANVNYPLAQSRVQGFFVCLTHTTTWMARTCSLFIVISSSEMEMVHMDSPSCAATDSAAAGQQLSTTHPRIVF